MGYGPVERFWRVELPVAIPVIVAGLRIATVTTVGLVAITTFIGLGGLGYLIINSGTRRFFPTSIYVGVALCVALAVTADLLLLWLQRRLTPWARATGR
jgi:osmoprotectant transport system permease protein